MTAITHTRRRTRADDVLEHICTYAEENSGATPSSEQVGDSLGLSRQRINYLMMRLELAGRIRWISRYTYIVVDSEWTPPPDILI